MFNSFYPFVQNSEYYNPDETGLAYVFRALSPILCGNCDRDPTDGYAGVYQPEYLYGNYHPHYPPGQGPTADATTPVATTPVATTPEAKADLTKAVKSLGFRHRVAADATTPEPVASATGSATTSAAPVTDGSKATPVKTTAKHRKPGGGLADAMKSLQGNVNASVAKMGKGTQGGTKKGGTTKGGTTKGADATKAEAGAAHATE